MCHNKVTLVLCLYPLLTPNPGLLVACSDQLKALEPALIKAICEQNGMVGDVLIVAVTRGQAQGIMYSDTNDCPSLVAVGNNATQ
jgi:hypothetical protein